MSNTRKLPVVAGVDGSDSSVRAVRWAAREAGRRGTGLRLVHACEIPTGYPPGLVHPTTLREALEGQGREWLARARETAEHTTADVEVHTVLEVASPVTALAGQPRAGRLSARATEYDADKGQPTSGSSTKSSYETEQMTEIYADPPPSTQDRPHPEVETNKSTDIPDEWGRQSFPASDPPQNW